MKAKNNGKENSNNETILKSCSKRVNPKSMLTYKEIMDIFEEVELEPEQIERRYTKL